MSCPYCPVTTGHDICCFHEKSRRLTLEGRCIWCLEPAGRGSYCDECRASRIAQGGDRQRERGMLAMARRRFAA